MKHYFFDAHCDTISELITKQQSLSRNILHLDFERLEEYDGYIQVFAAFVDKKNIKTTPLKHCVRLLQCAKKELNDHLITNREELKQIVKSGKVGGILAIEGGEALEGSLTNILRYYHMGVRLLTLTWNYQNELGEGILENSGGGLTPFGRQAIHMMEELGILIDVSHLSVKGFWDVVNHTNYPFVASHSNAKALCSHPRNLNDEQIKALIVRKGCIGINFYPAFLTAKNECHIQDIIKHMEHILSLGGENCLGFGTDFDGVDSLPREIQGVQNMKDVVFAMENAGFSSGITKKICFGNFYRIFWETLGRRSECFFK